MFSIRESLPFKGSSIKNPNKAFLMARPLHKKAPSAGKGRRGTRKETGTRDR